MNALKKITNIGYWILILGLFAIGGLAFLSANQLSDQYRLFVVQSGSMEPSIKTGSVVLVQPQEQYQTGDIITFATSPDADLKNPQNTVTHRVAEITQENNQTLFTTKGDANNIVDLDQTPSQQVLGKVTFFVPYIGYPVGFAKTQMGFVILVVIPATIIIYSELQSMRGEIKKMLAKRQEKKSGPHHPKAATEGSSEEEEEEVTKKTKRKKKLNRSKAKRVTKSKTSLKTIKKKTKAKKQKKVKVVVKQKPHFNFNFSSLFIKSRPAKLGWLVFSLLVYFQPWVNETNAFFTAQDTITSNSVSTGCWITPSVPILASPEDGDTATLGSPWDLNPVMDWNDSSSSCEDATIQYQYQSYSDAGLTNLLYESAWLNDSMIPAPGTPDGTYYWRVRAQDQHGNVSDWTLPWLLTVKRIESLPFNFLMVEPETPTENSETQTEEGIQVHTTQNDHNLDISFTTADSFTSVEYYLSYTHLVDGQEVSELVEAEFSKEKDLAEFGLPSIYLGTCSSGDICIPHTGISNLELGLMYKDGTDLLSNTTIHPSWVETP